MKTFFIVVAVLAVVVLIIVFRKSIGAFFSPDNTPQEGDACTDSNGNASTIVNGVCKEVVIPNPPITDTTRVILNVPETVQILRRGACMPTIQLAQYSGYTWNLYRSTYFYCYYRRA